MDLNGARILLTGASSGIGAALALALGQRGAALGLVARRADRLKGVLAEAKSRGADGNSRCWSANLSDLDAAEDVLARAWSHFDGLDAFVSNAAMTKRRNALRLTAGEVDLIMRVNFLAPAHMALALLPRMHRQGHGAVVIVGSIAGRVSNGGEAAYVASKHALAGFAETLAVDLADSPIVVRLVTPGPFDTAMWDVTDDEPPNYDGPKFPPSVAADAIVDVLEGTDTFETMVPAAMAEVVAAKNADVDAWIAMSSHSLPGA
jgi:NAD(P)-dependent dehydrogenase (short-subunit alcohol dehydrogenase family)